MSAWVAEERARALLSRFLPPAQRGQAGRGHIHVRTWRYDYAITPHGDVMVRTWLGRQVGVCVIAVDRSYQGLPSSDRVLTMLLRIRRDERRFLKIAVVRWEYPFQWLVARLCRRIFRPLP